MLLTSLGTVQEGWFPQYLFLYIYMSCTLQEKLFSVEYSVPFFLPNNVSGCDAFITLGLYRWISITATLGGDSVFSSSKGYSKRRRRLGKNFQKLEL